MSSATSEDVLLVVNHVRFKKSEGVLYLMPERMAWCMTAHNSFTFSYSYVDIKGQKISPDGKAKIQLQLVLHNSSTVNLHFNNSTTSRALTDRDKVKEYLQQLLPKYRNQINKDLEEKTKMMKDDPELFQLYKDLVVSQVISADEFWANRQNLDRYKNHQAVGVSAAFLADIKPLTDGCNGLRYNLTADVIESIFKTYPAVKQKHLETVPDMMGEAEFWTHFFQSHYFHRDRMNLGNKDVFSECARLDEIEMKTVVLHGVEDPFVDISMLDDSDLGEGYGTHPPPPLTTGSKSDRDNLQQTNQSLIRRFNHHNTMVMNTQTTNKQNEASSSSQPQKKKVKLKQMMTLDDLETDDPNTTFQLHLQDSECYLQGPTPVCVVDYFTTEDIIQASTLYTQTVSQWKPSLSQVLTKASAGSAVSELSPGGILMGAQSMQGSKDHLSDELLSELKQLYTALTELLRHYWCCYPVTSPTLEDKLTRMKSNLERFQTHKITPFLNRLTSEGHPMTNGTTHIIDMIDKALMKYYTWQSKKSQSKRS